jgi:putative transposase
MYEYCRLSPEQRVSLVQQLLVHVTDFGALGDMFRMVHGPRSREWNLQDSTPGRKVWYRYADRAIRSERHYWTTVNYVHYNPVKHGWVESPHDWEESSVHWDLEHHGREWLRDTWERYPVRDYGLGWDD